jgi:1-acyl-sn-glycerol-3-phosphate acyltransferase
LLNETMKVDVAKAFADKNPRLYRWMPGWILRAIENLVHQNEINEFLAANGHLKNADFARAVLRHLNIHTNTIGKDRVPKENALVLVGNHPLGGPDGLALFDVLGNYRERIASVSNDIILQIQPLQDLFVPVNKHGAQSRENLLTLKSRFKDGYGVMIFPAGLVSRRTAGTIRDLPWKKTAVSLARRERVPVVPVHISGRLSNRFYRVAAWRKRLGIPWNLEMLLLVDELFRLRNTSITLTFGHPLNPDHFDSSRTDQEWIEWLYRHVYELEGTV